MEQALAAAGVLVVTLTTDDDGRGRRLSSEAQSFTINGASRHYVRKLTDGYKVAPGVLPWLWRNMHEFDVAHIHAVFTFTSGAAAIVARRHNVPYVLCPHGALTTYGMSQRRPRMKRLSLSLVESHILRHAAAVHFASELEWEETRSLDVELRGVVIPFGIEPEHVTYEPAYSKTFPRNELGCAPAKHTVLYLSRIDPVKNVESLLRALTVLRGERIDADLVVAGGGETAYVESLKVLAQDLGVKQHVTWLGHVEGEKKRAAMAHAQVFVLPSHSESFGIAAIEAMLAGLPAILSNKIGIASSVQSAGAGVAVDPDPVMIAQALKLLLGSQQMRREMGTRARCLAAHEFSTQAMAQRLIGLYTAVCRQ